MDANVDAVASGDVADDASSIRRRRERLGISASALAREAGVDRTRVAKLEEGDSTVRQSTTQMVLRALDKLEHGVDELPTGASYIGDPTERIVEFVVEGTDGVRVVVKGPITDMAALQAAAYELVAKMRGETT